MHYASSEGEARHPYSDPKDRAGKFCIDMRAAFYVQVLARNQDMIPDTARAVSERKFHVRFAFKAVVPCFSIVVALFSNNACDLPLLDANDACAPGPCECCLLSTISGFLPAPKPQSWNSIATSKHGTCT